MSKPVPEKAVVKLTRAQIDEVKSEMTKELAHKPCRFMLDGRNLNITTGETLRKGTNVMYHTVYWDFTRETAEKIAGWLGCNVIYSE